MVIDGKAIAVALLEDLKKRKISVHLAIVLVGNDPASKAYVHQKELKAKEIGAKLTTLYLNENILNDHLLEMIKKLNDDPKISGIIVQRPLPAQVDDQAVTMAIDPKKDIDGLRPDSLYPMPIAEAVLKILENVFTKSQAQNIKSQINSNYSKPNNKNFLNFKNSNFGIISDLEFRDLNFSAWLKTKRIVVIGKGKTGGQPVINALRKLGIEPQIIDSKTENPQDLTKTADIIISAVGKREVIKPEMIKKGVILISVGLFRGEDGKLHGDYDEEKIKNIASFYTPTPGGVGPINVAMLLKNLIKTSENLSS